MSHLPPGLLFLKLGGSLITDKTRPYTPRPEVMARLAGEISAARRADPGLRLLLGHGAGSFAHVPAKKYGTRQGVQTPEQWRGFVEVWRMATALDRLVIDALLDAGLPALAFPPSAAVTARDGQVIRWDLAPLQAALQAGLLPVVYGDVIFDVARGGTILSTEDLFAHLAHYLRPERVLLAGLEPGVWADYPACTRLISTITPAHLGEVVSGLGGSVATDVTGGMASKVEQSLNLVKDILGLQVSIFSGEIAGQVERSLLGDRMGTTLRKA